MVYLDIEQISDILNIAMQIVIASILVAAVILAYRATAPARRPPPAAPAPRGGREGRRGGQTGVAAPGIDRALAQLFYRELRKAIEQGRVKPALVSDECPQGTIAYDFARQDWVCVEKDGAAHPLGEEPAGERLELESLDYEEEVGEDG